MNRADRLEKIKDKWILNAEDSLWLIAELEAAWAREAKLVEALEAIGDINLLFSAEEYETVAIESLAEHKKAKGEG